jgi:hypothetical protein
MENMCWRRAAGWRGLHKVKDGIRLITLSNLEITAYQRHWWTVSLELKLRKASGDAFQGFFSQVMSAVHGGDYFNIKPYGSLGDDGCDGYLKSTGQVFQCYGALGGEKKQVSTLVAKINNDFQKALVALPDIMKEWNMVHNLIDGMPVQAVQTLQALEVSNPSFKIGQLGIEGLAERIFQLPIHKIEALLGPRADPLEAGNVDANVVRQIVSGLVSQAEQEPVTTIDLRPVSPEKLNFNGLPNYWKRLIAGGWQGTPTVSHYFSQHPDPTLGDKIARIFRQNYESLKLQGLEPGAIMTSLFEFITGVGHVLPAQHHSALVLLTFLFENCDIFERPTQ